MAFYQSALDSSLPLLSGSDIESEATKKDDELDIHMKTIFEILLNTCAILNNREKFRYQEIMTEDKFTMPLSWRAARNMSNGLLIVAHNDHLSNSYHRRFE